VRTFAVDALRGAEILDVPALEIGDADLRAKAAERLREAAAQYS